jgi:hypothetical protein
MYEALGLIPSTAQIKQNHKKKKKHFLPTYFFLKTKSVTTAETITIFLPYQELKLETPKKRFLNAGSTSFSCFPQKQVTLANWLLPAQQDSFLRCDLARGQSM